MSTKDYEIDRPKPGTRIGFSIEDGVHKITTLSDVEYVGFVIIGTLTFLKYKYKDDETGADAIEMVNARYITYMWEHS